MSERPPIGHELLALFERAFESRPDALAVTTPGESLGDGALVFANTAFQRLTGRKAARLLGRRYGELCRGLERGGRSGPGSKGMEAKGADGLQADVTVLGPAEGSGTSARLHAVPLFDGFGTERFRVIAHGAIGAGTPGGATAATERHVRLLDAVGSGVLVHRDFRPLYANPACARLLGLGSAAEVMRQPTLLRFLPLESLDAAMARYGSLIAEGPPGESYIMRAVDARGAAFWAEVSESLVSWQGEEALVVSFVDASEHVRARKSEALLREAVDDLADSFILYDADDRVVLTNKRFHRAFPFLPPQPEIVGAPMVELVRAAAENGAITDPTYHPDRKDEWIAAFIAARHDNKMTAAEDAWPDGRWDLVKEQMLESGGFVSVRTDITDRKRAEFALRDHEERLEHALAERTKHLQAVLGNIAQGVIVLDPNLRVVLTNDGLHELIGYPRALGRPGTPVAALIRDRVEKGLYLPGEAEAGADVETIVAARLKAYRELTRESYRHPFPNGKLVETRREKLADGSIICTFTDVTDQVSAERELERQRDALYQREKLSALGMLLAGVAHELNNPLSVVLGQAALMESLAADKQQGDRAGRIRNAAERCIRIIKTFLAMARDKPPSRVPVQINALIEPALDLVAYPIRSNDIEVDCDLAEGLPEVQGDPDQLHQVLINLLINAAQALEESEPPRRIALRTRHNAANDEVELEIADSGPGVPEELRRRIFEPFFTTKSESAGTGVGLAVCHGMVTAHGGSLTVDNLPRDDPLGGGACFRIRLPAAGAEPAAAPAEAPADDRPGRVLLVDDEPEICELLIDFLEDSGLEIETAASGQEALQRIAARDFDAILCDLRMPGMDGPALFGAVARERPAMISRFIFGTGDLLSEASRQFLKDCSRPFLEKPFMPEQVRRLVKQVVRRSRQGRG